MGTVMPQSELVRKAVAWVSERRSCGGAKLEQILDEAGMRFNLSPNDAEFLRKFFATSQEGQQGS